MRASAATNMPKGAKQPQVQSHPKQLHAELLNPAHSPISLDGRGKKRSRTEWDQRGANKEAEGFDSASFSTSPASTSGSSLRSNLCCRCWWWEWQKERFALYAVCFTQLVFGNIRALQSWGPGLQDTALMRRGFSEIEHFILKQIYRFSRITVNRCLYWPT